METQEQQDQTGFLTANQEDSIMKSVTITNQILAGNIVTESGYDERASAHNLADLMETAYRDEAASQWPGADITIAVDVQYASGYTRAIVIEGIDDAGNSVSLTDDYYPLFDHIGEQLGDRFDEWAVPTA